MRRALIAAALLLLLAGCGGGSEDRPVASPRATATATVSVSESDAPARSAGLTVINEAGDEVRAGVGSTCLSTADASGQAAGSCIDRVYPLKGLKPLAVRGGETVRLEYAQRVSDLGDDVATASLGSGRSVTRDLEVRVVDEAGRKVFEVDLPSKLTAQERYLWTSVAVDDGRTTGQASFQARLDVAG